MADQRSLEGLERLLRESQLLAERERQRADTEQQRADIEQQRADTEQQRANTEQRRAGNRQQQTRRSQRIQDQRPQQSSSRPCTDNNEQYCTQKCLIGLVTNGFLDMHCPNVQLHCADARSRTHHPVSHNSWLKLLREQLEESLDNGVTPLKESGSRGALFRVVLLAYGYAFVAKGTVGPFIKDLEHLSLIHI